MRGVWEIMRHKRGERVRRCRSSVTLDRVGPVRAVESGLRFSPGIRGRKTSRSSVPGDMTSHGIPYPWLRLLRREVEDLVRTRCGERYLRERKAWTELAQINHELKLLQAQLAALEERRATLLPTSPNKVIIKA